MNKEDYTQTAYAPLLLEQENCRENTFRQNFRAILKTPQDLWEKGFLYGSKDYKGDKWGSNYLHLPDILFLITDNNKNKFTYLSNLAKYDYGKKPGKVSFFYVKQEKIQDFDIEEEYLFPIINSSRNIDNIFVEPTAKIFFCDKSKEQLINTGALKYIEWGEKNNLNKGVSVESNKPYWYSLKLPVIDTILFRFWDKRFWAPISNQHLTCSDNFFYASFYEKEWIGKAQLNSTFYFLQIEVLGRKNMGEGVLTTYGFDYSFIQLLNFELLDEVICKSKLYRLSKRKVRDIFTELGFDKTKPIRTQQPKPLPDRKELDDIIFDELDLTEEERKEVYWATAELVKQRIDKAGSRK